MKTSLSTVLSVSVVDFSWSDEVFFDEGLLEEGFSDAGDESVDVVLFDVAPGTGTG